MYTSFDFVRRIIPGTMTSFQTPVVIFPLAGANIDLWFANALYYDSGAGGAGQPVTNYLTCSRASIGYAKNSTGTLTQFGTDTLRIGTGTGLIIEDTRTNKFADSEDFSSVNWSVQNTSVTVNQAVAPNGTTTMDQVNEGTVITVRHIIYQQLLGFTANASRSLSVFAKYVDRQYLQLLIQGNVTAGSIYCYADLLNGTITDSGVATAGTGTVFTSATIESYAGGVYRIKLVGIPNSADTGNYFVFALSDRGTQQAPLDSDSPQYTGTSKSVYLWGAQAEQGTFVSSYIPTTTSAARAADNITTSGSLQTIINAATASIVAKINNGGGAGFAANVVDSNGTNLLGFNASNNALASITATLTTANTANRITLDKLGIAWDGTGRSLVLNAGSIATDAIAQTPSATQNIGSASGTSNFIYAYLERLTLWNTRLADASLGGFIS